MMKTVLLNQENISLDTALARKYEKREEKGDPRKLAQAAGLKLHIVPCVRGGERFRDKSEKSGKIDGCRREQALMGRTVNHHYISAMKGRRAEKIVIAIYCDCSTY